MCIHWFPREFLEKERELIDKVNLRLGYRLQLHQASWPTKTTLKSRPLFSTTWANAGVAPCYPGGHVAWTLKDEKGGIVAVFVDESFDVRSLEAGAPDKALEKTVASSHGFTPNMKPGTYRLFVSVGLRDGTPRIALPMQGGDAKRRYELGAMEVGG